MIRDARNPWKHSYFRVRGVPLSSDGARSVLVRDAVYGGLHLGFRESFLPLHDSRRAEPVETQLLPGPRRPFKLRRCSLCIFARRRLRRVGPQLRTWNTYVSTAAATYAIFNAL
ncbi:hypothetical protein NDU88_003441 [Pleurodeles waltl]|uniref:Uncharacterized protein n=1 Tax=Pleurodeles waltl TaxID=8319 RepID=A0AAV7NGP5_PLEWA|nr:hypothetical protein NDU88_003441 [Pleurodeles waltl]